MRFGRMIFRCVGGVMLAFMATAYGQAAPTDTMNGYKAETIGAIFTELGAKEMTTELVQNEPRLAFTLNEIIYVIDFFLCQDAANGCKMLQFVAAYDPSAGDTIARINSYNAEFVFGKAALDEKSGLVSSRAIIAEGGTSKAHIVAEFNEFVSATDALLEHMAKGTIASAPSGRAIPATLNLASSPAAARPRWASIPKNKR